MLKIAQMTLDIEVRIDERLEYRATAAMLMQPIETVGEADTLDAIKEIANMIAGSIKSSLPPVRHRSTCIGSGDSGVLRAATH